MLRTGCSPCPVVGGDPWTCRNRGKAATSERSCFDGIRWICGTCVPCRSILCRSILSRPILSRPILSRPVLSRLVLSFEADSRSRFLFSEAPGFSFLSAWKIIRNFTRFIIHRCGREPRFYSSWKKTTSKYSVRGCITCKTSIWKFLAGNWSSSQDFRVPASRPWLSIRSMPKGSAAIWRRFRPMPGSSSARWNGPMSIRSRDSALWWPSSRRPPTRIPVRRSVP